MLDFVKVYFKIKEVFGWFDDLQEEIFFIFGLGFVVIVDMEIEIINFVFVMIVVDKYGIKKYYFIF